MSGRVGERGVNVWERVVAPTPWEDDWGPEEHEASGTAGLSGTGPTEGVDVYDSDDE
jgi:hypothetical protein